MRLRGPKDECKDEYQGWRVEWPSRYQAKQPGPAQTYNQFNRCTQKAINIKALSWACLMSDDFWLVDLFRHKWSCLKVKD